MRIWNKVCKTRSPCGRDVYATVVRQWERDRALPAGQRARRRSEVFRRLDNLVPTGSLRAANPTIIIKVRVGCNPRSGAAAASFLCRLYASIQSGMQNCFGVFREASARCD